MTVLLGSASLTADDVFAVAENGNKVAIEPEGWSRLAEEKAVVDRAVESDAAVYGVTTGLGARSQLRMDEAEASTAGLRTVRARATATGPPLPTAVVRAAMLARLASFARGGSGIAPDVAASLTEMLNRQVHPTVPRVGSIGSSDLVQMAHVGLVVAGEGEAEMHGTRMAGGTALRQAGLESVQLDARDGLALCAASPLAAGTTALCLTQLETVLESSARVAALSFEGWRAGTGVIDDAVLALRPQPGQVRAAERIRKHLAGGDLLATGRGRRLQDPISFRCVAATQGALEQAVSALTDVLSGELNGNGDNPAVLDGRVVPTGNFHTPLLALSCDQVALAVTQNAAMSVARLQRFLEPGLSGLPENLTRHGAGRAGFAPTVKTAQALLANIHHAATPLSVDTRMGAASVEDHSTNAFACALRLVEIVDWYRHVLAIEALAAAQACDLLADALVLADSVSALRARIRGVSPALDDDRPLSTDIEQVALIVAERMHVPEG
ncbi:MAG: HAL/PAL/TAL family ammonia-lyase [Nocardioidaceae bacterium]